MAEHLSKNKYEHGLGKNAANFTPLTPLSFIERTARVFPDYTAVIHGEIRRSWAETYQRCIKLASALHNRGVKKGDTVAMMLPNVRRRTGSSFWCSYEWSSFKRTEHQA